MILVTWLLLDAMGSLHLVQHIVELAKKTVKRSTVVDSETGEVRIDVPLPCTIV
jgi:hypothetical protein